MTKRPFGLHPTVVLLASTHFLVDGYSNIYSPLLPVLIPQLGLSLATAGLLQMFFQISTSVSQLAFGHLADRWRPRVLLVAGPVLSVVVLSLLGLSTSAWMLGAVLVIGGLGGAAFHPPAAALVHRVSTDKRALAMSVHITGGSFGFALGPVIFAPFVQWVGLRWTPLLMIPGLLVLARWLPKVPPLPELQERHEVRGFRALRPYARPLTLLYLIVVLRTLTAISVSTFLPVMLTRRGLSVGQAGVIAGIYLLATSAGGFLGGTLADRWGARRIIIASLLSSVPFLAIAPSLPGVASLIVLSLGGFLLQSTLPVNVTFGQSIAPISAATVSSLMMGFAWGTGGLLVPLVGLMADHLGLDRALTIMALLPLVAGVLALPLPEVPVSHRTATAAPGMPDATGTDVAR